MKKKSILVIEDDPSIRFLLDHILLGEYEVELKDNGFDALVYLQNGNIPDLIISDLSMPKMSGYDFMDNIKTSSFFNNIPLIVLSAVENSSEKISCLKKGADDYLVKPFNPEELQIRVSNILKRIQN